MRRAALLALLESRALDRTQVQPLVQDGDAATAGLAASWLAKAEGNPLIDIYPKPGEFLDSVSVKLTPGIKPFIEGTFDQRHHDISVDRSGIRRDSRGNTLRAGSTFELTRQLTGEISAGMQTRDYDDPSLRRLTGMLVDASFVWAARRLTNVKFLAKSSVNESTQANVSGVIARDQGVDVNHDLRRWVTLIGKLGMTSSLYQGSTREDNSYAASAAFVYKLTRTTQVKGEARREWLKSSINGSDYTANIFTLGLRFQR